MLLPCQDLHTAPDFSLTPISLTFSHPANLPGVGYAAESSPDLQIWTSVPLELLDSGPPETWHARDPLTGGAPSRRFLRLLTERK